MTDKSKEPESTVDDKPAAKSVVADTKAPESTPEQAKPAAPAKHAEKSAGTGYSFDKGKK